MEQEHLDEFERRVAFFARPSLRRMLASPVRFTGSKLLEAACMRLGRCVRTRSRTFWGDVIICGLLCVTFLLLWRAHGLIYDLGDTLRYVRQHPR